MDLSQMMYFNFDNHLNMVVEWQNLVERIRQDGQFMLQLKIMIIIIKLFLRFITFISHNSY